MMFEFGWNGAGASSR